MASSTPSGGPVGDADDERAAAGSAAGPIPSSTPLIVPDVMAIGKQRGENVIERHGWSSRP